MSTARLERIRLQAPLSEALRQPPAAGGVDLYWLGQAGFALRHAQGLLLIDPYLSDSLFEKYKDTEFRHERMMDAPMASHEAPETDWVLATHRHSDHLDPGTVPAMMRARPELRLLVPAAIRQHALDMGLPEERVTAIDAGEHKDLGKGVRVDALASAHEELDMDEEHRFLHLGYVVRIGGVSIYHSGDCVPYPGLATKLACLGPDLALLPINGRDEYRRSRRVPGNFDMDEAMVICRAANIPNLIGHHFGMFAFNTVDPARAARRIEDRSDPHLRGYLAALGQRFTLRPAGGDEALEFDDGTAGMTA